MTILRMILDFFGGSVIEGLINAYKAKLEAAGKQDALATELAVKELEAEISARAEANKLLIAETGRWYTAMIRPLFALPLIIYFWKTIVWDKVLGWGATDPLTGMIGEWAGLIIIAYFGGRSLEKVAKVFARRR